jgi:hypothetical protein
MDRIIALMPKHSKVVGCIDGLVKGMYEKCEAVEFTIGYKRRQAGENTLKRSASPLFIAQISVPSDWLLGFR